MPGAVFQTLSSSGNNASSRLNPSSSRTRLSEKSAAVWLTAGLDEGAGAHFGDGLTQFVFRIHDDRPVPRDRFFDRLAGDEQKTNALLAGLHRDFVAAIKQDERSVAELVAVQAAAG